MTNTIHIMIDGSYFIFYRFFALVQWWKLAKKEDTHENLHLNEEFVEKFKALCIQTIQNIPKKLKLHKSYHSHNKIKYYVGKDCNRSKIWRNEYIQNYKSGRTEYKDAKNNPGEFFKIMYDETHSKNVFEKAFETIGKTIENGGCKMLQYDSLEADDCIALYTKYLLEYNPHDEVIIITSDMDYMQLIRQNVSLFNLKYKNINTEKNSLGCEKKDLLCKIIMGDKSDNIPSIFPKCGFKTAKKYVHTIDEFQKKLSEKEEYMQKYKLNKKLIDFDEIPIELKKGFYKTYNLDIED